MLKNLGLLLCVLCFSGVSYAADWVVSSDLRERYQTFNNFDFDSAVDNDRSEFDSRLYIKAKKVFDNGVSVFFQPQAVLIQNKTQSNGTQSFSQADLYQAYVQYDAANIAVRIGRQQLVYGDQRLLGHLGWKDVARTFDGAKVMYKQEKLAVDVFAVHPADIVSMTPTTTLPQGQSLVTWEDRTLMGVYGIYNVAPKLGIDVYFINWQHSQQASAGQGRDMNTFGTRLFGQHDGFDGTFEAVFQNGTWKTGVSQQASAYAMKAGYTFDTWKTRLGVEYNYSPGDDKTDVNTHKDFVFPFHTNHAHYGEMDFFSWANMKDVRLSAKTSPSQGLTLMANVHFLSLDKATGDWLNVVGAGNVFAGSPTYTSTDAGTEIDLKVVYKIASVQGLKVVGLYGVFNPGAAVVERNAGKADSAIFAYLIAQYVF